MILIEVLRKDSHITTDIISGEVTSTFWHESAQTARSSPISFEDRESYLTITFSYQATESLFLLFTQGNMAHMSFNFNTTMYALNIYVFPYQHKLPNNEKCVMMKYLQFISTTQLTCCRSAGSSYTCANLASFPLQEVKKK